MKSPASRKVRAIPFAAPCLGDIEAAAVKEAIRSGWLGSGVYTRLFEKRLADAVGRPFAAATNSGTAALHLALRVLDLEGAEVITTPLTVASTNHAILYNRAIPVFCDVEEDTGNLDWRKLESLATRKTKAILVVHLNGHACDMDPIIAFARERGLAVVEDACSALPTDGRYKGKPFGSLGDLGCFSFSPFKNLTTLDGGAVICSRPAWAARLSRLLRLGHRMTAAGPDLSPGGLTELGYHYRINELGAVIGLAQLDRWGKFEGRLRETARRYREGLEGLYRIETLEEKPYARRSLQSFLIRVRNGRKRALRAHLKERGIETCDGLFPNHLFDLYRPYRRPLPVAERLAKELLYLPFHPSLKGGEVERIVDALRRFTG